MHMSQGSTQKLLGRTHEANDLSRLVQYACHHCVNEPKVKRARGTVEATETVDSVEIGDGMLDDLEDTVSPDHSHTTKTKTMSFHGMRCHLKEKYVILMHIEFNLTKQN